jgi:uncharacterized protein (TIGR02594 family)
MSSIAMSATPAFAQSSQEALNISNGRVDFTDISAQRRHQAKPRYKKARSANARHAGVQNTKARSVNRHTAKRPDVARNTAGYDAFASIPNQHGVAPTYQYGPARPHRISAPQKVTTSNRAVPRRRAAMAHDTRAPMPDQHGIVSSHRYATVTRYQGETAAARTTTPTNRKVSRRRTAPGHDAHASIPDRHSIVTNYQYGQVQPYQTSAYYAVTSPNRPEPRRRTAKRRAVQDETDYYTGWGGSSVIVAEARRYIGTNPTKYSRLWCAYFMNMVLERTGHRGTGSGMAKSFASYGTRVSGPQVGAIAVMSRGRNGGHVGVVSGIDEKGNPIIISGNHNKRVAEAVYPRGRIYAYVMP